MPRRPTRSDRAASPSAPGHSAKHAVRQPDLVLLPLRRQTLTGMTADAIRERILRGHYAEGSPLRQDAIASELGVSRIPVREALRQLEAEGLVTFSPHRGAVVSTLSLKQIEELYELRADIESDIIRRAVPRMTTEDDARAAEILDAYEAALHAGQVGVWGALNWQFHSTLYAPADRELTMSIVRKLHQQSDRYSRMQLWLTHGESRARYEHRAIATAVKKRDATKAARLMHAHILTAGRALVTFLEKERAQGEEGQAIRPRRAARRSV